MATPTYGGYIEGRVDPAEEARLRALLARGPVGGFGSSGGGASLPGAAPRGYDPASGGVPGTSNPISTILGNMGGITNIQTGLTDNALELLRKQYPTDFFALQQMNLENAKRRAAGDISDLLPEMWQRNAEAAVGGGYGGSALENSKRLRDMGLTRLALEKGAEESMKNVYGTTPTVHPQDMSGIIGALVEAQRQADIMAGAPVPEAAYRRARDAAGGGGGGGGGIPGVIPGRISGGSGASKVDDILKRMGGNTFGPPIIARGTAATTPYSGPAPYGSIPYGSSADSYVADLGGGYAPPPPADFGGSLGWGGGQAWGDFDQPLQPGWATQSYANTPAWTGLAGGAQPDTIFDAFNTDWMGGGYELPPTPGPIADSGGGGGGYGYDDYFPYGVEGF